MAYTYPPLWYEDTVGFSNTWLAAREWLWWVNGVHPTATNTVPWTVVECYDGTTRLVPTNGDLSTLDASNRWSPDTGLAAVQNMWLTLQAPASGNDDITNRFQIFVQFRVFTVCRFQLLFLNDWSIGAGSDFNPTVPTASEFADIPNHFDDYKWLGLLDEGTLILMIHSTASGGREWIYMGEVQSVNPITLDPRPFVMSAIQNAPGWRPGGSDYRAISAVDNSTIVNVGVETELQLAFEDSTDNNDAFATRPMCRASCYSNVAGHRYQVGIFRNLGAMSRFAKSGDDNIRTSSGYTGSDNVFEQWNVGVANAGIIHLNIPEQSLAEYEFVSENSVPDVLIPSGTTPPTPTPPTVTFVSPPPNTTIRSNTSIVIDVTDMDGFAGIQLRVQFKSAATHATETIHGGDVLGKFEPFYQDCTVTQITDGYRFVLTRVNPDPTAGDTGWLSPPTFVVTPIDSQGTGT